MGKRRVRERSLQTSDIRKEEPGKDTLRTRRKSQRSGTTEVREYLRGGSISVGKMLVTKQNSDAQDPCKRWVWQCVPVALVLGDSMGTGRSPKLIGQPAWANLWASGPVRDPIFKTKSGRDW